MKILIVPIFTAWLTGCASQALVVGQTAPALASEEVDIYYVERPRCNFETIAYLRVNGGYFTLASMFSNMRSEAARLGASGIYVLETRQLETREFLGTAKAIRCLPA